MTIMDFPDIYKDVMLLRYNHDLEDKEISEAFGIFMGSARVQLYRALVMLKTRLMVGENYDNAYMFYQKY